MLHALDHFLDVEHLLLLQPTSTLRNTSDIEGIINLTHSRKADSAASVTTTAKHPEWMFTISSQGALLPLLTGTSNVTCRQHLDPVYVLNGTLYLHPPMASESTRLYR